MNGLIAVLLRGSKVVLQFTRHGVHDAVYDSQRRVTIHESGNKNAECDAIGQFIEPTIFENHFSVRGIESFDTVNDMAFDPLLAQFTPHERSSL